MLLQHTIDGLNSLKLFAMTKALETQMQLPDAKELSFEERLGLLVDCELTSRDNKKLQLKIKQAKFPLNALIENVEAKAHRGITRSELVSLSSGEWWRRKQNIIITGPTGVGKTYLACALGHKACRDGLNVLFVRTSHLFQDLAVAKLDGRYTSMLASLARKDLLIIDDFGLFPLSAEQRQDLLEIVDDRYSVSSTLITSQFKHELWHEIIGEPTIADAILDRVVHNSYKLGLKGESRRKVQKGDELQIAD